VKRAVTTTLALVALAVALPVAGAQATTAQQAIDYLNAQRAANGIPAGIVENPEWSQGCAQHNAYLQRHPEQWDVNAHDEDPGKDGYTPTGQQAAQSAVLTSSDGYAAFRGANPWERAPIHLMQMLAPALSVTGYADTPGACLWTWPGYQRAGPEPPAVYTYPGEGATIYSSMGVSERPFSPGEFVGISQADTTGPHLYFMVHGADVWAGRGSITSASLSGPEGQVQVRTVDNNTVGPLGDLGSALPPGGIVIPVRPLGPGRTYNAGVTFTTNSGVVLSRTWSFRTRPPVQPMWLDRRTVRRGRSVVIRYVAAASGRIRVSLRRGRRTYVRGTLPVTAGEGFASLPTRERGRYTVRAVLTTTVSTRFAGAVRVTGR
jgi:hypothetical protein